MQKSILVCLMLSMTIQLVGQVQINPEKVEVIRDQWGVPHIYAETDAEVAYGLAWAHSEDDFKNIQLPLLIGKQMLGRKYGKQGAAADYLVGLLRMRELAQKAIEEADPAFLKIAEGYRQGINAFARKYPEKVLVKKAFPVLIQDVYTAYGISLAVISGVDKTVKNIFEMDFAALEAPKTGEGSNSFAVSRDKTNDNNVFLAVNSHQPLEGPTAWYEAHLVSEEGWNMMGGLFPGAPVVFVGTNPNLGWCHTVNYPDKIDVYQLQVNADDPYQYKIDNEWKRFETDKVKLKVKLFPGIRIGVKKEVLWSDFGPAIMTERGTYAFHMGALEEIRAIEQWYEMNKANDFEEFMKAIENPAIPGFNIVYADQNSNIAHIGFGKLPIREKGYNWRGVVEGINSKVIHKAYHPLSDLPQNLNPASGYVFNTNNSAFSSSGKGFNPLPSDYDHTMGFDIWENNRSTRYLELMGFEGPISYDQFKEIKYDITLPDSLVFPLDINPLWSLNPGFSSKADQVASYIREWNKTGTLHSVGPVHAIKTYENLQKELKIPYKGYYRPSIAEFNRALEETHDFLLKHHGTLDVPLSDFQFLVRGKKALPLRGVDDVLAAMRSVTYEKGTVKGFQGESYIMMVKYPTNGLPIIETVNAFGASNDPDSPHYDDQMDMFVNQQLKLMTLDIDEVRQKAERIYHPN